MAEDHLRSHAQTPLAIEALAAHFAQGAQAAGAGEGTAPIGQGAAAAGTTQLPQQSVQGGVGKLQAVHVEHGIAQAATAQGLAEIMHIDETVHVGATVRVGRAPSIPQLAQGGGTQGGEGEQSLARPQDSAALTQDLVRRHAVLQHEVGKHHIDAAVREGQGQGIALHYLVAPPPTAMPARPGAAPPRMVHRDHLGLGVARCEVAGSLSVPSAQVEDSSRCEGDQAQALEQVIARAGAEGVGSTCTVRTPLMTATQGALFKDRKLC